MMHLFNKGKQSGDWIVVPYNLGSKSWLAQANGTAVHYAPYTGRTMQLADTPLPQTVTLSAAESSIYSHKLLSV